MSKQSQPQILVIYTHAENKLFYVSQINENRVETEGRVEKQYSRARSMHRKIIDGKNGLEGSGFMYAIINTDFTGWTVQHTNIIANDGVEGAKLKADLIEEFTDKNPDFKYVGSSHTINKGVYGAGKKDHTWSRSFNVANMKKDKIDERIDFIMAAMKTPISPAIKTATYLAITVPDTHGPRSKNFGSYEVNSLSMVFLFVRNCLGYDLP